MRVKEMKLRKIFATNSQPTLELELETQHVKVRSSVPLGTSRGSHEVNFLPVEQAIKKFHSISHFFISEDFSDQKDVDDTLHLIDKTPDFREIGGNLALAISSAFLKAFAAENNQSLVEFLGGKSIPRPVCNVIGGWRESDIQEFLLLPVHQESFFESITEISSLFLKIGGMLKSRDQSFNFGMNIESAWVTKLGFREILSLLTDATKGTNLKIGLDVAATHLWDGSYYVYSTGKLDRTQQLTLVSNLVEEYPIVYIEDPFHEDDFMTFASLNRRLEGKILVGDDLYATNLSRLEHGIDFRSTNAVLIKPNQVGTITDVMKFVKKAKENGLVTVISHRSGETEDTLICHLAVGLECDYIKIGIAGERIVKINEMIRIEEGVLAGN